MEDHKKYEVLKTTVLGLGPWYVSPRGESEVLGMFRSKTDAEIFAEAKTVAYHRAQWKKMEEL